MKDLCSEGSYISIYNIFNFPCLLQQYVQASRQDVHLFVRSAAEADSKDDCFDQSIPVETETQETL
jgi:hypothetical protein